MSGGGGGGGRGGGGGSGGGKIWRGEICEGVGGGSEGCKGQEES